ncbi:MAG: hypothetical protein M1820_008843 [Bogoriella megaspora]|nr:MAG: hypothetical protein M1820_008843 [Bogoriella megaspora]
MAAASNIRASVQWKQSTVFAGEEVECIITFKNIAPAQSTQANGSVISTRRLQAQRAASVPTKATTSIPRKNSLQSQSGQAQLHPAPQQLTRQLSMRSRTGPPPARGHRPTLSLSTSQTEAPRPFRAPSTTSAAGAISGQRHGRSISILSTGGDKKGGHTQGQSGNRITSAPIKAHARSTSLNMVPRRPGIASAPSGSPIPRSPHVGPPSPSIIPEKPSESSVSARARNRSISRAQSPHIAHSRDHSRRSSAAFPNDFSFPARPPPKKTPSPDPTMSPFPVVTPTGEPSQFRTHSPRPLDGSVGPTGTNIPPMARIMAESAASGTPRTSTEIYAMSNHSEETMASDYLTAPAHNRAYSKPMNIRRISQYTPTNHQRLPETLMMGYAQLMGSFTLDGALVNQAPFEEVKRKGVVGGQGGGGVVGVERAKKDTGLFGSFGWGNIGESLGGLLGGGEMSSIKEMRGIANMKTIPLLSTPQSILFVDLQLAPGESKSYKYSFNLPRGLPPTFKGRAMKVSYYIAIGTQRAATATQKQQVKQIEVPFRVFGGVNPRGEILGHDLMSPYIILRDQARTQTVADPSSAGTSSIAQKRQSSPASKAPESSLSDFQQYVNSLLTRPRTPSSAGLLSPTHSFGPRRSSTFTESGPLTVQEAINFAILRSNMTSSASNQSRTRFDISRTGSRVAIITLARPAYRLGETITMTLDFDAAVTATYAVNVQLETTEKVDPAIALRSAASIARVTRRTHALYTASALYARRLSFQLTVPPNATPEFVTSGVCFEWRVKVEFVTPRLGHENVDSGNGEFNGQLLEEVNREKRGVVMAAVERLPCESFEVAVPIRVYGAVAAGSEGETVDDLLV